MPVNPPRFPLKEEKTSSIERHAEPSSVSGIHLEGVSFSYAEKEIFRQLHFNMEAGRWTCLIGPSGCGKSTLLKILSGSLQKGLTGSIRFALSEQKEQCISWMAQKDLLLPWLTLLENVCLGARLRGELTDQVRRKGMDLLEKAGLADYGRALPSEMSGGMRQRAALLRTIMEDRPIILMDEPFSALDALTRLKLQGLSATLLVQKTVLMVTHDPLEALRLGHKIHVMRGCPAQISRPVIPPGAPPRKVDDPEVASLQGVLLQLLEEEELP